MGRVLERKESRVALGLGNGVMIYDAINLDREYRF